MGRINSEASASDDADEEAGIGSLRRQPSSATAGSIPAQPGAYRVESRAPNRQRRGIERSGGEAPSHVQSSDNGRSGGDSDDDVVDAECTDAAQAIVLAQSQLARAATSAQLSLPAIRVEEGQTQVVEALDAAVIDDGISTRNPHKSADRIRKKDWIIVGLVIGVAVIVVAVVLGIRLS